jgi:heme exporter protein C
MRVTELANPSRFLRAANLAIPWLGVATLLLFAFAIYRAVLAPDDYQQGATVKIMFLHVPSAWLGMLCWGLMTVAALGTLVWRHPLADVAAKAAAPLGAAFTLLCLVTGSLWGRPEWGTYWVWDARLTSELILFLLYLGVIALGVRSRTRRAPRVLWRSSPSSAPSICRSSNSRSIGGTRFTKALRSFGSAARPSTR